MRYHYTVLSKLAVCTWSAVVILLLVFLIALPSQATIATPPAHAAQHTAVMQDVQQIAAGGYHSCARKGDGSVYCWGAGAWGQLGNGEKADQLTPVVVSGMTSGISAVAAGWLHTCAVTAQGGVKCWGRNFDGQLGDSSATDRTTPVNVTALSSGVSQVAAGGFHTCALTTGGGVRCWGYNGEGQLGDATNTNRQSSVNVSNLASGVLAIAAGQRHTCALLNSGSVKCWGANDQQQLGNGSTLNSNVPVDATVLGATQATAIATGDSHTCVLTTAGNVTCWGNNSNGQLGTASQRAQVAKRQTSTNPCAMASSLPSAARLCEHDALSITLQADVAQPASPPAQPGATDDTDAAEVSMAAAGMTAVAVGGFHTCAITASSGVQCWGGNFTGQLGNGSNTSQATPADVSGLSSDVRAVAAGRFHTCALTTIGTVLCWGLNAAGQVGDSSAPDARRPVASVGLSNVSLLTTGEAHTCVLIGAGAGSSNVKCMGWNGRGQLADNTVLNRQIAVDVTNLDGELMSIVAGGAHTCGVTTNGTVKCWGSNSDGQLGDQTTTDRLTPVDVANLSGVTALASGDFHTCALTTNGSVKCWGDNSGGQLGDGTLIDRLAPVDVSGLSNVKAITAGKYHTCALTTSGSARCWGWNANGQLGDGTKEARSTPITVSGLSSGVGLVVAGNYHTCALMTDGSAKCWGWNSSGQIGDNSTTERTTPSNVAQLNSGVKSMALGNEHTCALLDNQRVKCWGNNTNGQLGTGTNTAARTPVDVVDLNEDIAALALGDYFTCAHIVGGTVKCWGWNGDGQLGDGNAWRLTPVTVGGALAPPTATPTPTATNPASPPTDTPTATAPTVTPSITPTPPTGLAAAAMYLPLVHRPIPITPVPPTITPVPQPLWQRVGEAGLNVRALAVHNDQLFLGERKEGEHPGGLYRRALNSCQAAPAFTRVSVINNSSVLGLAFQDTLGVAATYDINIFYSTDNGGNWNQSNTTVVRPRTVAIAGGSVFYAGTEDTGIYESVDGGVTWRQIESNPPAINRVVFDTGTLWIGAQTGVFKRTLGGLTQVIAGLNSEASKQVWDFAFRAANDIYIATFDGVYRGDGANGWQPFGLQGRGIYSLELKNDRLYAGVQNGGVWQRALNSSDWTPITSSQWNATATVHDLLFDATTCNGLLAATADGLWLYR